MKETSLPKIKNNTGAPFISLSSFLIIIFYQSATSSSSQAEKNWGHGCYTFFPNTHHFSSTSQLATFSTSDFSISDSQQIFFDSLFFWWIISLQKTVSLSYYLPFLRFLIPQKINIKKDNTLHAEIAVIL